MEENSDKPDPNVLRQGDLIAALNDNNVPLHITLRALVRLKVIEPKSFMKAVRDELDEEYNRYPPEPEFKEQLDLCYGILSFNVEPEAPPLPTEPPSPQPPTKKTKPRT